MNQILKKNCPKLLILTFIPFLKVYLFVHQSHRERGKGRDLPVTVSQPRCLQYPGLAQAKASSQGLHPDLLCEWLRSKHLGHLLLVFPSHYQEDELKVEQLDMKWRL